MLKRDITDRDLTSTADSADQCEPPVAPPVPGAVEAGAPATPNRPDVDAARPDIRRFAGDPICSPALLAGLAWSGGRVTR